MSKRFIQVVAMLLVVLFLSFSSMSCYGSFNLVKKLYQWNGSLDNKYASSAVMWIMFIIPVYGVATFIDFVRISFFRRYMADQLMISSRMVDMIPP